MQKCNKASIWGEMKKREGYNVHRLCKVQKYSRKARFMKENETFAEEKESNVERTALEDLLQELSEELDCKDSSPEEIRRAIKKRKLKKMLQEKAKENSNQKRCRSRLLEAKSFEEANPKFELQTELKNPLFAELLRCGVDLESAYSFVHRDEIIEKIKLEAEQTGYEKAVAHLRSGALRPEENGLREQGGISEKKNVANLTGGGIRDILRKVEKGAKVKF